MFPRPLLFLASLSSLFCLPFSLSSALTVTPIASGFGWIENLAFDGLGTLFASDLHGTLSRVTYDPSTDSYATSPVLTGYKKFLGLALDPANPSGRLFAAGLDAGGSSVLLAVEPSSNSSYVIAKWEGNCPNGLGYDAETSTLYASSEGNFFPGGGFVYEVDVKTGVVTTLKDDLWAADGLWIDSERGLLYVGQLIHSSKMWVYDLRNKVDLGFIAGLPHGLMDDFTLSPDGRRVVGADWTFSRVVSFPAYGYSSDGEMEVIAAEGFGHITSVRYGKGKGFEGALFVSEGSVTSVVGRSREDRILKIDIDTIDK